MEKGFLQSVVMKRMLVPLSERNGKAVSTSIMVSLAMVCPFPCQVLPALMGLQPLQQHVHSSTSCPVARTVVTPLYSPCGISQLFRPGIKNPASGPCSSPSSEVVMTVNSFPYVCRALLITEVCNRRLAVQAEGRVVSSFFSLTSLPAPLFKFGQCAI